jgi:diguanylate cyclase (GGDEF)-like protein
LLLDPQSGRLLAMDAQARVQLSPLGLQPGVSSLEDLLPQLTAAQRAALLTPSAEAPLETTQCGADGKPLTVQSALLSGPDYQVIQLVVLGSTTSDSSTDDNVLPLHRDALTRLPDRRALALHYANWQRLAAGHDFSFAVLFIDIDQFKPINDQHGHATGDQVLVELAARWQSTLRAGDLLVRYGGDEFVALLAQLEHRQQAEHVMARLTAATAPSIEIEELSLKLDLTIGAALSGPPPHDLEQLIAAADRDMYAAKRRG